MALRLYIRQNETNDKVGTVGNYYAHVNKGGGGNPDGPSE